MSWQVFLSVPGKGGSKGKTLAGGKQRDQFIVGNSLRPAPGEVGSFFPSPIYLVLGRGGAACVPEPPRQDLLPLKKEI